MDGELISLEHYVKEKRKKREEKRDNIVSESAVNKMSKVNKILNLSTL